MLISIGLSAQFTAKYLCSIQNHPDGTRRVDSQYLGNTNTNLAPMHPEKGYATLFVIPSNVVFVGCNLCFSFLLLAAGAKRRRILCFNSKNWLIL
jgi:hypothetical protein